MKKISIIFIILLGFSIIGFADGLKIEQSKEMISKGNAALMEKDIKSAKMFMRRAIQLNPYSTEAWEKYDELMKIISRREPVKWDKIIVKGKETEKEEDDPFAGFD